MPSRAAWRRARRAPACAADRPGASVCSVCSVHVVVDECRSGRRRSDRARCSPTCPGKCPTLPGGGKAASGPTALSLRKATTRTRPSPFSACLTRVPLPALWQDLLRLHDHDDQAHQQLRDRERRPEPVEGRARSQGARRSHHRVRQADRPRRAGRRDLDRQGRGPQGARRPARRRVRPHGPPARAPAPELKDRPTRARRKSSRTTAPPAARASTARSTSSSSATRSTCAPRRTRPQTLGPSPRSSSRSKARRRTRSARRRSRWSP